MSVTPSVCACVRASVRPSIRLKPLLLLMFDRCLHRLDYLTLASTTSKRVLIDVMSSSRSDSVSNVLHTCVHPCEAILHFFIRCYYYDVDVTARML